ncbi:MAG TPA: hypothetical protein PKU70_07905 [Vicinamibacteria bacterium]|nr:hypothetical protein [Vicinamibacteria bacterium]HRB12922.1 hypothetical protein [Vicinamibacteria bacterium]
MRRLFRAEAAGKLTFGRIVVIDRDPLCAAASLVSARVRLDVASWNDWLAENLSHLGMGDHLVPYHWAPHVLLDWLAADLARHGLSLRRTSEPGDPPSRPPVLRETKAGDLAMSYAEWLCPPACIEPALCPHTRGPKSWSLAGELARAPRSFVFPCLHLAYGVGTIPLSAIFGVRDRLVDALRRGEVGPDAPAWIASASHCHGLAARVTT